ncbi:MAG: ribbon-helix-helix domain-containing protein [Microcystaceae cyanobacterium]
MQIVLPPELEQLVRHQIESGKYQTALEVLLAGVRLLEHQDKLDASADETWGELDKHLNFAPLTEAEMIQQSLELLASYQQDAIPHDQVEAWARSLGTDHEQPCPQ